MAINNQDEGRDRHSQDTDRQAHERRCQKPYRHHELLPAEIVDNYAADEHADRRSHEKACQGAVGERERDAKPRHQGRRQESLEGHGCYGEKHEIAETDEDRLRQEHFRRARSRLARPIRAPFGA